MQTDHTCHHQTLAIDRFVQHVVAAENKTTLNNICSKLLQRSRKDEDALRLTRRNNAGDETCGSYQRPTDEKTNQWNGINSRRR